jgi:hypothetical protein
MCACVVTGWTWKYAQVMSSEKGGSPSSVQAVLDEALERGAREADPEEVAEADTSLDELMNQVADPPVSKNRVPQTKSAPTAVGLAGVAMRTAAVIGVVDQRVSLEVRGVEGPVMGELAPGVSSEVVAQAAENGDSVVLECVPDAPPLVVGVLQTRIPETLKLRAKKLHLEGDEEVLVRSGLGAMRIRRDGDVELVGSRIAAMSRGLFRLVGRVLRLN